MSEFLARIERLSSGKRDLLERHKRERLGMLHIRKASRTQPLPLSFAQQRLWFLAQLEPESLNAPLVEADVLAFERGEPPDGAAMHRQCVCSTGCGNRRGTDARSWCLKQHGRTPRQPRRDLADAHAQTS